jgi:protein-S-isoprenylcysteine O-methyltransferase Ste14
MSPRALFIVVWVGWIVSWTIAALWSGRTEKRLATREVWEYRIALAAGIVLFNLPIRRLLGLRRIWHVGYNGAYLLAILTFAGLMFAWWARIYLGQLWSGSITRKEGHHVVDTGPYAFVRHPIYTGLIAATLATATAAATAGAILGGILIIFGLWLKARTEEHFLSTELGPGAYSAYQRRVPMLVPFI